MLAASWRPVDSLAQTAPHPNALRGSTANRASNQYETTPHQREERKQDRVCVREKEAARTVGVRSG
ncbi:unnamed protein product, partial [Ectocarpus sp. 4 AP-2014]